MVHTTRVLLLFQFKLNPSVKFSGYETVGNYHHHTWDEEQNEEQQNVPKREKESKISVNEKVVYTDNETNELSCQGCA